MISNAYAFRLLIGNQLLPQGDRHLWSARLGLGGARRCGHAGVASTRRPLAAQGLPPKGGHPTLGGHACAHRSPFEQSPQRRSQVVSFAFCAAPKLLRPGVGVRERTTCRIARPPLPEQISFSISGEVRKERTPSGLRPPVDFCGAGAHALMRAPALSCCMGCRP